MADNQELSVVVTQFAGAPAYKLAVTGTIHGERGDILKGGTFAAQQVVVSSGAGVVVLRAILPRPFPIPAALIHKTKDEFRTAAEIDEELAKLEESIARRFRLERDEALRRLRTIEVDWASHGGGIFFDTTASVDLKGEARLALGLLVGADEPSVQFAALAEFRATGEGELGGIKRHFGIVVRFGVNAAATIALDFDDLNISLPEITLPTFDFSVPLRFPDLPDLVAGAGKLAGVFSSLVSGIETTCTWNPPKPILVVRRDGTGFLFAALKADHDLSTPIDVSQLAALTVTATHSASGFTVTTPDIKFARHKGGMIVEVGNVVKTAASIGNGTHGFGPLVVEWKGVTVKAEHQSNPARVFARVHFDQVLIRPNNDPSAVIAFRGDIDVTPSGNRIVNLDLVEPYPFELVRNGAEELLHAGQRIIQLLAQIKIANPVQLEGIKKVLDALGRIAAAVAEAAVFGGQQVRNAAIKVGEAVLSLLKIISSLLAKVPHDIPDIQVDIEVRVALAPFELRQIMLTLRGAQIETVTKTISGIGFELDVVTPGRPALLIDFVTEPGAYFFIVLPSGDAGKPLLTLSTDLWLRRPGGTSEAMRDADGSTGERAARDADKPAPLIQLGLHRKADHKPLLLVLAGLSRGKPVFFKLAGDPKRERLVPRRIHGNVDVIVLDGPFTLERITNEFFNITFDADIHRVLPLLGMNEPGVSGDGNSFVDKLQQSLGQVVRIERFGPPTFKDEDGKFSIDGEVVLAIQAAGVSTSVAIKFEVDESFEFSFTREQQVFPLKSRRIDERALGLTWIVEQADEALRKSNAEVAMFEMAFAGGESGFQLTDQARMLLRFDGISSDGEGIVFHVRKFHVGRGGLDLLATIDEPTSQNGARGKEKKEKAVRLNGIDVPFRLTSGSIEIASGKFVGGAVAARGQLPPALVGDAMCSAAFVFGSDNGEIVLESGKVELEKKGEPIVCHSTRFTLTITDLDIAFVREGGYHFYFLVSGSLRFTPKAGEFSNGLLKQLKDIEITVERTPLSADPRVLLRHISFQKALNPKKTFSLFNIFTFELRGFGFHPASPKFAGHPPALNISGQIRFAELGDVMQPKIDFHELWIAPPAKGESLPRIKAEGLGVELQLAGAVKVRGAVLAVDHETRTVEGREFAPPGYNTSGFLGEGAVDIPGLCSLEASLGFLEVEKENSNERKKAFFLYLQADKLAVEIPTPIWTFYLREAGFGFGYRYTLAGIKDAEQATSAAQLVKVLDDVSRRQGDLSRFTAWKPDVKKDNFTLALRGAFQMFPAQKKYNAKAEKKAVSPLFFDIVAALRSDFTFLMSARGWLGVNYASFLENKDNFREKPGFRGYLYISVPRSELLLRSIADSKGFIGNDWAVVAQDSPLRRAAQSVDWTSTLYIRPGLFHMEMGWPDQLSVRLVDEKNMRAIVRGGMIFRAAEDGILYGFNMGAEVFIRFEGRAGHSIGVAIAAELEARLVARVLAFLSANFTGSLVYGLVSLDARLAFSVRAWMEVDLGFKSFTIRIGFVVSLQFSAAVELVVTESTVGARVAARVAVRAFGCSIGVGIGFTFNDGALSAARARVERFLALSITSEQPNSPPVFATQSGDRTIESTAGSAQAPHCAPAPPKEDIGNAGKPPIKRSQFGRKIPITDFWLIMREATVDPTGNPVNEQFAYALLVPKEARLPERKDSDQDGAQPKVETTSGFYVTPARFASNAGKGSHTVTAGGALANVKYWKPGVDAQHVGGWELFDGSPIKPRWDAPIPVDEASVTFTLGHLFDECFLADTEWKSDKRETTAWKEPNLRIHKQAQPLGGVTTEVRDQERDLEQKANAAQAIEAPYDERAHQARSTVMTMFLDQFISLSATGSRVGIDAHVTDLGLVFYGPIAELEQLAQVTKHEATDLAGNVEVFNPAGSWFTKQDPILADDRTAVEHDGIKLDWNLEIPFAESNQQDPEHFLHHYEIVRTIERSGTLPHVVRVKPAATIGARDSKTGEVTLLRPDWQFIDALGEDSAVPPEVRQALLPGVGQTDALEAANAWLKAFKTSDEITVTYSVTPVDIAGTRGLPRSFLVDIRRPQVPIRPAIGELRVVQTLRAEGSGAQDSPVRPDDLEVFLAISDPAWTEEREELKIGDSVFLIDRVYRIIADPDEIEPAGHYGSDAATSRIRGPGAFAPPRTADEHPFEVLRKATVDVNDAPDARAQIAYVESDEEALKKLPRWARLSSVNLINAPPVFTTSQLGDFLQFLWAGSIDEKTPVARVATRFFLETMVRLEPKQAGLERIEYVSKRVSLPVEHMVRAARRQPVPPGESPYRMAVLRPEAFEWSVPLVFPALGQGQVRTGSGFVRFHVPHWESHLSQLDDPGKALLQQRDAERRVLTSIRFAAVPDWVASRKSRQPHPFHGNSIAGFDVYELDIDDLAPMDISRPDSKDGTAGKLNEAAWQRARRVARVEHLSREDAHLVPAANVDWQGWQAHYPSETRRLLSGRRTRPKSHKASRPVRGAWYSDHDSTPGFASRRPRLRLLPLPPESAIAELMRGGTPTRVRFFFVAAADSEAATIDARLSSSAKPEEKPYIGLRLPELSLQYTEVDGNRIDDRFGAAPNQHPDPSSRSFGLKVFDDEPPRPLKPADLRNLLLTIGWGGFPKDSEWLQTPDAFDGLTLVLEASAGFERLLQDGHTKEERPILTGRVEIPLELRSAMHPFLDEIVSELALNTRIGPAGAACAYRHFTVMPEPVTPVAAKDLSGFMAASSPEADPYGWKILQLLGHAVTLRLFDPSSEQFLDPEELRKRVAGALRSTLCRWKAAYPDLATILGQQFVEIFLKPGADRLAAPFDAVAGAPSDSSSFNLADRGLAFVQLSLRPRPTSVWNYWRQRLRWKKNPRREVPKDARLMGAFIEVASSKDLDVARALGGPILELRAKSLETDSSEADEVAVRAPIPLPGSTINFTAPDANPELELHFRAETLPVPKLTLVLEVDVSDGEKNVERQLIRKALDDCLDTVGTMEAVPEPSPLPDSSVPEQSDPFARFETIPVETWTRAFKTTAAEQFRNLRRELAFAGEYTFPEETAYGTVVSPYLAWSQRFLDHCAGTTVLLDGDAFFALAAPTKATPWRLAADAEGFITLSFLHSDRWAHARAYAVKPVPRYHHLLAGLDVRAESHAEVLEGDSTTGYAVAVSPRTERIETPVVLPSEILMPEADGVDYTEFIVARHGEEALAMSNRPLLARLGMPTSLITFTRSYRFPNWPSRLHQAFKNTTPANVVLLPPREAKLPARPDDSKQIDGDYVGELAKDVPSLWKGGDIWRVDAIPPHYRMIAFASERAGIVVSDVASIVRDEQPRKLMVPELLLPDTGAGREPASLTFVRDPDTRIVRLVFTHALVSHEDVTPDKARRWFDSSMKNDVREWPDPDVLYVLTRRLTRDEGKAFLVVEEDADTRLLADDVPPAQSADPPPPPQPPVLVRARGPRYAAAADTLKNQIIGVSGPPFRIHVALQPRETTSQDWLKLNKDEWGSYAEGIDLFNKAAKEFATILTPHELRMDLPDEGQAGADYIARLRILHQVLEETATKLENLTPEWSGRSLAQQLRGWAANLATVVDRADPSKSGAQLRTEAGLETEFRFPWIRGFVPPKILPDDGALRGKYEFREHGDDDRDVFLVVFGLASQEEIDTLIALNIKLTNENDGRLYRVLGRRILGNLSGFWLQAVDTRTRMKFADPQNPTAPGVVETRIAMKAWLENAAAALSAEGES